ncbi:MAG TPA: chemotaxis protein CheW [Solimonas sp.]|nr:chemotaxis protein CheW [Solimonas sp.]
MSREQIYAVLIALHEDTLLLPNAAVAEVLSREALQAGGDGPDWLLGYCEWNNRRVPVLQFESLNGAGGAPDRRRERIVVINSLGRHLANAQLAFVTQGYPHLVTLNRSAVRAAELRDRDRSDLVLSRVRIANQEALIPDLDAIEAEVMRAQLVS